MDVKTAIRPIVVLLIEDNPGDVRLVAEALRESKLQIALYTVTDGVAAMDFLHQVGAYTAAPRPDLICLDLHLPRKDGRQVLQEVKSDPLLAHIPVAILTTSDTDEDIEQIFQHHANCYIRKPLNIENFIDVVQSINHFWFAVVTTPSDSETA